MAIDRIDFIHIGLPKAGSTWLQDVFFQQSPEVAILGSKNGDRGIEREYVKEVRSLVSRGELSINSDRLRDKLIELMSLHCATHEKAACKPRILGISHEVLSGQWLTGKNSIAIARTFHSIFPTAKVILFLREQKSMILSSYRQYIRNGGTATFRRFLMDPKVSGGVLHDSTPWNTNAVEYFKYSRIVETYESVFGRERLHIECFERLRNEKQQVVQRLCKFLGMSEFDLERDPEVNRQLSESALRILRQVNKCFTTFYNPHGLLPPSLTCGVLKLAAKKRHATGELRSQNPYVEQLSLHSGAQRWFAQRLNSLLQNPGSSCRKGSSKSGLFEDLSPTYREWLFEQYGSDNHKLQKYLDFSLAPLGYEMQ